MRLDAELSQDGELAAVSAENGKAGGSRRQRLRDHRGEPPVAEDERSVVAADIDLLGNLARRRDELGECRLLVAQARRNDVEILDRECQVLGECAVSSADADDAARRAVLSEARLARRASAAGNVDLADDAFSDDAFCGRRYHGADELVPRDAAERHVAPHDLEVRGTDPREMHLDEGFARPGARRRRGREGEILPVENERFHFMNVPCVSKFQAIFSGTERSPAGSRSRAAMRSRSPGPRLITACGTPGRIRTHRVCASR